jgi:TetR/AcrR family transcriptional regulator, cholesterol catabolism regulator
MDTLTKILTSSVELFTQYGFKTITMDDIARRAGISKKTLYQHFATKQEVVSESVVWYKNQMCDKALAVTQQSENAVEAMVRLMEMMDQTYRRINPLAMLELQRFFSDAFALFREKLITQDVEAMRDNILRGMEEELFRKDVNADLMARYHIETALMLFQSTLLINDRYDLQFVSQEIMEHFLYGLMTPKGVELYHKYKNQYLKKAVKI